jgi:hypothetical protein
MGNPIVKQAFQDPLADIIFGQLAVFTLPIRLDAQYSGTRLFNDLDGGCGCLLSPSGGKHQE